MALIGCLNLFVRFLFVAMFFSLAFSSQGQQVGYRDVKGLWLIQKQVDTSKWVEFYFLNNNKLKITTPGVKGNIERIWEYCLTPVKNASIIRINFPEGNKENYRYYLIRKISNNKLKTQIQNSGNGKPSQWVSEDSLNTEIMVRKFANVSKALVR